MADFEKKLGYTAGGADPEDIKINGFQAGYKPPASYFNWLFTRISECIDELQTFGSTLKQTHDIDIETITNELWNKLDRFAYELKADDNLNACIDTRMYIYSAENAATIANVPVTNEQGTLLVYPRLQNDDVYNLIHLVITETNKMYVRNETDGVWSDWVKIATDADLPDLTVFEKHLADRNNPHGVTKEQLGIDLTDFEEHIANKSNPHDVTAAQVNAVSKNGDTMTGTLVIKDGSLKIEHGTVGKGGVGTEIYGLNGSDNENGHHYLDISHIGAAALARLRMNIEENGSLYTPKYLLQIRHQLLNGEGKWYNVFHDGNKPSGSYKGLGSTTKHTVQTGGIGNVLMLWCPQNGYRSFVLPTGLYGVRGASDFKDATDNGVTYSNGVLTVHPEASSYYASNDLDKVYYYQCL